jgi:hypothetical protein
MKGSGLEAVNHAHIAARQILNARDFNWIAKGSGGCELQPWRHSKRFGQMVFRRTER